MALPGGELELVLPNGDRVALTRPLTIGRSADVEVQLDDRTVSRRHAQISLTPAGPAIEDAGSRGGTWLSGRRLHAPATLARGDVIDLGDSSICVQEAEAGAGGAQRGIDGPGSTMVVPLKATLTELRPVGVADELRPRVRSGWSLKRLGVEEGHARYVLCDLRTGSVRRMEEDDAALFALLDGTRTAEQLVQDAIGLAGAPGPGRLTRLVVSLAESGLIAGVASPAPAVASRWRRVLRPRERTLVAPGHVLATAYRRWGKVLFTPSALVLLVMLAITGFGVFAYLIGARYGTPFVVAHRLALGGAIFVAGRVALVAVHEFSHGLALTHYGRSPGGAGVRLMLIFPYAFIDTNQAYLEPRAHRMVIGAAGPVSDVTLGALFACLCAVSPPGAGREILFQLAFGAYLGAFFNLNPFLDRDGYSILVDYVSEPRLRARAREQLAARLAGVVAETRAPAVIARYALAGLAWSALGTVFAVVCAQRYESRLGHELPSGVSPIVFGAVYVILVLPVVAQLALPVIRRRAGRVTRVES